MRALRELGTVVVAGFVAFFSGLLMIGAVLILWFLGLVSTLMLIVSAFGGLMYLMTGKAHDAHVALVYLAYAAVPFVASFAFHVYRGKWTDGRRRRRLTASD
jgi:amino acid transporter